ncbi:SDR family NAD(P)-dependent oxidoreductase [uncultured Thiohalocapsa sp.]|uniref:SDR family NAD(P)-dependent oxidoreductase n=1 Tax=uncultured Thiohalocapsa sp. TaxID=768990 RepID=UPI0025E5D125|nr:SDR family NAD(P)-dependent oxidoreductase [uncultured Thiohalocapsa sp.]
MRGLKGKRVVVTGGARGIGRAAVERLLEEGARVAVIDQDAEGCRALNSALPEVVTVCADVADEAATEQAFTEIEQDLGGLDALFNNAGISAPRAFPELSAAQWRRTLGVDLDGVFLCARAAARRMGEGVIINMGSVSGMLGMPGYADYNAAKAGVIELTRTLALELAPRLRVVCISPGYVLTPMQEAEYSAEEMAALNARIPLQRHADPTEIAALVAFLASDEATFITGSNLVIDGGESAGGTASL